LLQLVAVVVFVMLKRYAVGYVCCACRIKSRSGIQGILTNRYPWLKLSKV